MRFFGGFHTLIWQRWSVNWTHVNHDTNLLQFQQQPLMQDPCKNESLVDDWHFHWKMSIPRLVDEHYTVNQSCKYSSTLSYCIEIHHKVINYIYCRVGLPYYLHTQALLSLTMVNSFQYIWALLLLSKPVSGEIFEHTPVEILMFPSPTGYMVWSFRFSLLIWG